MLAMQCYMCVCVCFKWCKLPATQLSTGFVLWKARCFPKKTICKWWVVHISIKGNGRGHSIVCWLHPTLQSHGDNWIPKGEQAAENQLSLGMWGNFVRVSEQASQLAFGTQTYPWVLDDTGCVCVFHCFPKFLEMKDLSWPSQTNL